MEGLGDYKLKVMAYTWSYDKNVILMTLRNYVNKNATKKSECLCLNSYT